MIKAKERKEPGDDENDGGNPSGAGLTDHINGANGWDLLNMELVDAAGAEAIENGSA